MDSVIRSQFIVTILSIRYIADVNPFAAVRSRLPNQLVEVCVAHYQLTHVPERPTEGAYGVDEDVGCFASGVL